MTATTLDTIVGYAPHAPQPFNEYARELLSPLSTALDYVFLTKKERMREKEFKEKEREAAHKEKLKKMRHPSGKSRYAQKLKGEYAPTTEKPDEHQTQE